MVRWIILLLAAAGCTVLEDRQGCPCWLTIDMQEVDRSIKEWHVWLFNGSGDLIYRDTLYRRHYQEPYVVEVPRHEKVQCLLWGNIRDATSLSEAYSLGTFMLKEGGVSADSLYFSTDTINTSGEESYLKIVPNKEFATVDIIMKGWIGIDFDVDMTIECASSGFFVDKRFCGSRNATNLKVKDIGNYYTRFSGRILRQYDTENLVLTLYVKELLPDGTPGKVLYDMDIPIGDYLESNGYNMYTGAMEDITMELDFTYNNLLIKAEDWSAEYKIVEEI